MQLKKIFSDINTDYIKGPADKKINNIVYDSREVEQDDLFICIEGLNADGHNYIPEALKSGAKVIVLEKDPPEIKPGISYVKVDDTRKIMGPLAARFYDFPLSEMKLIGVTGTNGKTTCTYLIKNILETAGFSCGLLGTINVLIGDREYKTDRTTPEAFDIYRYLQKMRESEIDIVIMEVSSHALKLKRAAAMNFDAALFTNISQDHLDFHGSLDNYASVKAELFSQLKEEGWGVVNADDRFGKLMSKKAGPAKSKTYSLEQKNREKADFWAEQISLSATGSRFKIKGQIELEIELPLAGRFNVYNALASAGTAYLMGAEKEDLYQGLSNIQDIPGRFEQVDCGQDFGVIVDYAHTPDGLENVLQAAQRITEGKIIAVFGCGGDRDREKRPLMGKIGVQYADYCFITSDNPRSEDPRAIISQIEKGIQEQSTANDDSPSYEVVSDRRTAIAEAIRKAGPKDMVLILGKGHETTQVFEDHIVEFDDREAAKQVLQKIDCGDMK